jgi:hypothetical protein
VGESAVDVNIGLFWLLLAIGACKDALTWSHGRNVSSETWSSAPPDWRAWLNTRIAGDGSGDGDGDGDGYGSGSGDGDGDGDGIGYGDGDGYGIGYGDGYGSGYGYGIGYGDGDGIGDGYGDGDGSGDGYGSGYGDGDGSGSGSGYGSEDIRELMLPDGAVLAGDVPDQALQLLCEVSSRLGVDLTA